ncbi:MAG: sulfate adenylyltransferase [Epsilonproteobacteria bacterium]|nr:MAG: sulfate adenylyltransferase [Campylobacterota bacterium]RLA65139.1 MAG: sulfate adenylyltransferase [Campylobacterota bacterium]
MDILKFATVGSVDDGKSTLIGRLLFDSKSIYEDQLAAITETSKKRGEDFVNLALLTDGLRAEREQGITIDVAYRYFSTPQRKFIIADCPGHIEYTRNMVTGASSVDAVVILIDARHGVVEQTKRHSFITSLLQVKHLIVCINKMDLVDYSEDVYNKIKKDFSSFLTRLSIPDVHFIPISALDGDNVVDKSKNLPWYGGSTFLYTIENLHLGSDHNHVDCRFPIQIVIRPNLDYRAYAGRVESGVFKPGDEVRLLPSGFTTKIKKIETIDGEVKEAFHPMSVNILLEGEHDLSRGDMITKPNNQPEKAQDLDVMLCWLNKTPLNPKGKYIIKHTTKEVKAITKEILYKVNINNLHKDEEDKVIRMNDVGRAKFRVSSPLFIDKFKANKNSGSLILIDQFTNETVAAGLIL